MGLFIAPQATAESPKYEHTRFRSFLYAGNGFLQMHPTDAFYMQNAEGSVPPPTVTGTYEHETPRTVAEEYSAKAGGFVDSVVVAVQNLARWVWNALKGAGNFIMAQPIVALVLIIGAVLIYSYLG